MFGKRSPFNHPLLRIAVIGLIGTSFIADAIPPEPNWWREGNPPVIDPSASLDDHGNHGMANVGQAKWMAQSALVALGNVLGNESPTVVAIRGELLKEEATSTQGVFFPERPENPSQEWLANQKAPLEIGALKALAAPFYKHLSALDGSWVEARLLGNGLQALNTDYFQDTDSSFYPWNPAHNQSFERNHAATTVGQLKLVFSLDFGGDFETGELVDGIPDLWEAAVVAANNNDAWTSISQINASTAVTAGSQTGTGNPPTDRDGDGLLNDVDADPDDKVIDWSPGPNPNFVMVELPLENVDQLILDDFTESGTVLLTRIENSSPVDRIVVDKNLVAHPFAHHSPFGGAFEGYGNALVGEQVPGFLLVNGSSVECLWDPLTNTFTPWQWPGNYHDDVRDDRNGVTIWYGQHAPSFPQDAEFGLRRLPGGALLPGVLSAEISGTSNAFIEENGNVVSDLAYWRKNPLSNSYLDPEALPGTSSRSATLVRSLAGSASLRNEWNLVGSYTGMLVSKNNSTFIKATGKLGSAAIYGVTKQGWAWGAQGLWVNGKWQNLSAFLSTPAPAEVQLLGMLDTGLTVARIRKTSVSPRKIVILLPVEVVELAPNLRDESDAEIVGSEKPAVAPKSTEMVERDPSATPTPLNDASAIRIAWRDMKVKIGAPMTGKKVTWSMTPQFTPLQSDGTPEAAPRFRGKWGTAANTVHRHRFSASEKYGVNGYESIAQILEPETSANVTTVAQTTVDVDGYTAIRVNLAPLGFNKALIKISIEDVEEEIDLIELEVPAVIVIDPGHGTGGFTGNSAEGSVGLHTNVTEGDAVLDIGTRALNEINRIKDERGLLVRKHSTKNSNDPRLNIGLNDREEKARQYGADTYVSLHFDGATTDPNSKLALYRNPFGMIDQDDTLWNRNPRADWALARRVRMAVQTAIAAVEPAESIQASETAYDEWNATHDPDAERLTSEINESRLQIGLGALNDGGNPGQQNGNYRAGDVRYTPCRATLIEMERTANMQADNLFNGNTAYNATTGEITLTALAESMRARVATEIAGACIDDALIRDLADQADVPVRTNRVPRLDFENE